MLRISTHIFLPLNEALGKSMESKTISEHFIGNVQVHYRKVSLQYFNNDLFSYKYFEAIQLFPIPSLIDVKIQN